MADSGAVWSHSWTYQNLRVHGGKFRRSPGLQPEYGYVDLDYADLKDLDVPEGPQWFDAGMGPKDIRTFFAGAGSTGGEPQLQLGAGAAGGGGLAAFGDLVMSSSYGGEAQPTMTYSNIFVASEGTEELTGDLSDERSHSLGKVRVQLTDIRSTYEHGSFFGRINCRMPVSGKWVKNTTEDGRGSPWSAQKVLIFLVSELTGSPRVHFASTIFGREFAKMPPPVDVVGQGEPAAEHLARLLRQYGLTAYLLPDNNYLLAGELDATWGQGEYAFRAGEVATVDERFLRSEKKAVSMAVTRAAAVLVVGKERRRAITLPYVPVIKDPKSGRILPMNEENCEALGIALDDVKHEVFRDSAKNFRQVKPLKKKEGFLRAQMFREWAYKMYAPATAFATKEANEVGLSLEEFAELPFMPMHEAPWKKADLAKHGLADKASKPKKNGALGDFVLYPPVVFAAGMRQGFYKDFDAIKDFFKRQLEGLEVEQDLYDFVLSNLEDRVKDLPASILEADKQLSTRFDSKKAKREYGVFVGGLLDSGADKNAARAFGGVADPVGHAFLAATKGHSLREYTELLDSAVAILKEAKIQDDEKKLEREIRANFKKFETVFKEYRGVQAWANFPHGPVSDREYSLDENTGLLSFSRPMCRAEQPFLLQPEGAAVAADGAVYVTFGYEYNFNLMSDYTSVLMVAKPDADGSATAVVAGLNRGSAVKPVVERDQNLRLYEDENGNPYNVTEVVTAAIAKGLGALTVQRSAVGYAYVLQGLHQASLDAGISSVQHEFDGDRASTHIMVNSPGARGGPLGKPKLNFYTDTGASISRDQVDAARERRER